MTETVLTHIIEAGLKPPKTLTLSITNGCNLRCLHCWPRSGPEFRASPVPVEAVGRLVAEFVPLGIEQIIVAGGEPLTHPDWSGIAALCCNQPNILSVCLQTNATLISKVEVDKLSALGCRGLSVQVSLDGATAKTHDYVRGKGSFERTLCGLKNLVAGGLGKMTRVAFTEMGHNFDELPVLLEILADMGIGGLVTGTLVRDGRAAQNDALALPAPSQYRRLIERYRADPAFRSAYEGFANIAALEWYKGRAGETGTVCRCIESPYVAADGRMYPCALFQADAFAVADAYRRPFAEVLHEALPVWAGLPEISRRRTFALEKCRRCPGRRHCGGGCMGRAYAAYGTVMREEDRCSLRQEAYTFTGFTGS